MSVGENKVYDVVISKVPGKDKQDLISEFTSLSI